MCDGDGDIVTPPPHGEIPPDSHYKDPEGQRWWSGAGNICGVLPTGVEVGGMYSVQVPIEGTQPGEDSESILCIIIVRRIL